MALAYPKLLGTEPGPVGASTSFHKSTTESREQPRTPPRHRKEANGVLLVDDHAIFRAGVALLIHEGTQLTVCGEASSAREAMQAMEKVTPALVIVDLTLAQSHGLDLIRDLHLRWPHLPMLVLSMHEEAVYALRCLREGARGYLMKHEAPAKLLEAIRKVLAGEVYVSDPMRLPLLQQAYGTPRNAVLPLAQLTNREVQVLELLGKGWRNRQIARQLHLSVKTVETYSGHIKEKLGLKDAASLVQFAIQTVKMEGGVGVEEPPGKVG